MASNRAHNMANRQRARTHALHNRLVTRMAYTEVASADGAWTQTLRLPAPTPVEQVRQTITEAARVWPVAGFLLGRADEPVEEVLLYRDPSRTYGTPDSSECDAAARTLVSVTGWTAVTGPARGGVLVGLGLREGYDVGATQHSLEEVANQLTVFSATGWRCCAARLVSARFVDQTVRWYAEDGVVVQAEPRLLPAIQAAAFSCAQDRYVVTHLTERRTYTLQQTGGCHSPG
ncbi:hypothetical protein AB0465_37490 [Streptomyces griseoviridis]|uniref:hypothetical protein n=1 Tax=Streptomyces griseoviridis TaxID=45398 RepID=UPI00344B47A3